MATKSILGTHAVIALMEQAKRFDVMSVHLAKSADLATSQADEIATWTSKLINAATKIQRDTQRDAAACRGRLRDKIRSLETRADSTKRKILDTAGLESSRTIKANFRLIFGPPKNAEYRSRSTKSFIASNLDRINTIRGLCVSHPSGVIALSTSYPTKVWTESSSEIFDGLIKLLKDETEQDWPEEIVDIMDELETERPMSVEFGSLRTEISQRQGRCRRRFREFDGHALDIAPLPPVQTGDLATQTLSSQQTSRMSTSLPSLQQMALIPSSLNHNQTQHQNDLTTAGGYDGTFDLDRSRHLSSMRYKQQEPASAESLLPYKENREMKHMCTNAPANNVEKLPEPFRTAIKNSRLWKSERKNKLATTGCLATLFPKDNTQDVSLTIWCGNNDGYLLTNFFGIQVEISS